MSNSLVITLRLDTDQKAEVERMFKAQLKGLKSMTGITGEIIEISQIATPRENS